MIDESSIRAEEPNERIFLTDVVFQAQHANRRILPNQARIRRQSFFRTKVAGTVVRSDQQTKRVAIDFARELHGEIRIDDCSGVHRRDCSVEDVDTFQEERAFLGKENRKALVRGDDQLV